MSLTEDNFIKKLNSIYKIAYADRLKYEYQLSDHWKKYYENQYLKFSKIENIRNFRSDQLLSKGCDDSDRNSSLLDLIEYIKNWELDQEFLIKNLSKKNIGNNNTSKIFLDYHLDYAELVHIKFYLHIRSKIKNKINFMCEIGGGFGSLARIFLNQFNSKYILIDLPEANLISAFYLQSHFPNKKFFLYDDFLKKKEKNTIIDEKCLEENDIFILPPWTLNSFSKKIKIDMFVNTYSFMEMKKETLKEYFDFIHQHSKIGSYFLNINRYKKNTSGEIIKFSEYPYDNGWDCLVSERSPIRYNIHVMLTERKKENIKNPIKKKLEELIIEEKRSFSSKEYQRYANIPIIGKIEGMLRIIARTLLIKIFGIKFLNKLGRKLYNINKKNT
jgi:putative sugar O-methyltransferase